MKYFLGSLLFWGCMQLSTSLPVEELPGFTPWSNRKRDVPRALSSTEFSGDDGVFDTARFGVPDPTCRKKLPDKGCDTMDKFTVQVST